MNELNLSAYVGKKEKDPVSHEVWNGVFGVIQTKVNEIIAALSGGSGETPGSASVLFVNGEPFYSSPQSPAVVELEAASSYELSGRLYGRVQVDCADAPASDTHIRLSGVEIVSLEDTYCIGYTTPEENKGFKDLVITLEKDSVNCLLCMRQEARADGQAGALYSQNNLRIQGEGYLSICNRGGHGVRATELLLAGARMYVEAVHDAFHAKKLDVADGVFYVGKAHDAFGCGSDGRILWCGGTVKASNLDGQLFHRSGDGVPGYYIVPGFDGTVGLLPYDEMPTLSESGTVIEYDSKEDLEADVNGLTVSETKVDTGNEEDEVYEYVISKKYALVSGALLSPIRIPEAQDVNLYLSNAYLKNVADAPGIYYAASKGRLKLIAMKDTVNAIVCRHVTSEGEISYDADAVKSENNISVELKSGSVLYVTDNVGDGLDGGDVKVTDSKGTLVITGCGGRGIKGNAVAIGADAVIDKSVVTGYEKQVLETCALTSLPEGINLPIKGFLVHHVNTPEVIAALECSAGTTQFNYAFISDNRGVYSTLQTGVGSVDAIVGLIAENKGSWTSPVHLAMWAEVPSDATLTVYSDAPLATMEGVVVVKNNVQKAIVCDIEAEGTTAKSGTGFADIFCRQGSKLTKGAFWSIDKGLPGVLLTGSIGATIQLDFGYTRNIYYRKRVSDNAVKDCGKTFASYQAIPFGKAPVAEK